MPISLPNLESPGGRVSSIFEHLREEWQRARGEDPLPEGGSGVMSNLSDIGTNIRDGVSNADQWLTKVINDHVPQILEVAARYENSPIVQALEAVVLPPEVEQQIAGIINTLAAQYPAREAAPVAEGDVPVPPEEQPPA